jgi:malate/lactate dehydrogenase
MKVEIIGAGWVGSASVWSVDYSDLAGSSVVMITAGVNEKGAES